MAGPTAATTLSQIATSGSNFLFAVAIARAADAASLGAFGIAYVTFTNVQVFARSTLSAGLLLSKSSTETQAGHARAIALLALLTGLVTLAIGFAVGLAAPVSAVLAAGVLLGLVQDGMRYRAIQGGRWRSLVIADVTWFIFTVPGLFRTPVGSPLFFATVTWALGALISGLILWRNGSGLVGGGAFQYLKSSKTVLLPLCGESGIFVATGYAVNWLVVAFGGLAGYGLLRATQTIFSPVGTLAQAMSMLLMSGGIVAATSQWRRIRPFLMIMEGALIAWGLVVGLTGVGPMLVGDTWSALRPYLLWIVLGQVGSVFTNVITADARRYLGAHRAFVFRSRVAMMDPIAVVLGGLFGGAVGPVLGLAASQVTVAGAAHLMLRTPKAEVVSTSEMPAVKRTSDGG